MKYRTLGQTNFSVSALCLGTMQFGWTADEETSHAMLDTFTAAGGTFLDTADIYTTWYEKSHGGMAEEIIGRWMHDRGNRKQLVVATKGRGRMWEGPDGEGLNRAHLTRAVEDSLRRLQTDYIDLYQTHWPDESTPIEETLGVLDELVKAGKIRAIGCSNITASELRKALAASKTHNLVRYETLQPHYNLAHREEFEAELQSLCLEQNIGVIPYSPLGGGFLTGKYRRGQPMPESARASSVQRRYFTEHGWRIIDALDTIAEKHTCTVAQGALAWMLAQPAITAPIIGASKVEHLNDQLGSLDVKLDTEDLAVLNVLSPE